MLNSLILLTRYIEKEPAKTTSFIANILGYIINFVFNIISSITISNSLGLAIILFTIIARFLMIPLNYKQQRSMFIMQKIKPKVKKIQKKYKGAKDPESARKMQVELTALYAEHNCSIFSGCLPMLIQFPIFLALYFIMKNPYLFISKIGELYTQIGTSIQNTDGYLEVIKPMAAVMTPRKLSMVYDLTKLPDLLKYLSKFTPDQWEQVQSALPSLDISGILAQKMSIETFFGINLTESVEFTFNSIGNIMKLLIPILSGITTFLSSWTMFKIRDKITPPSAEKDREDELAEQQQKMMLILMPIMFTITTFITPCGVGLYWIAGNIVQIIQQLILTKHFEKKFEDVAF